jgi:hypothetical protein
MVKHDFRCGTKNAIEKLAYQLSLPYNLNMQGCVYEVANHNGIQKYII